MEENKVMYFIQIIFSVNFLIWLFIAGRIIFFYLITIKKWQKTEAKIIDCNVKWFRSKTDSDTEGWKEMIKYHHTINSTEYENDCVTKNIGFLSPFKNIAKKYNFKENQKIEIAYNPANPQNSIIDTKINPLSLLIPIGFFIVMYLFLF